MLSLLVDHSPASSSIHAQISRQIQIQIETGVLPFGYRLPPTRELARQISISRGTAVKAYQDLTDKGLLESNKKAGTTVRQKFANVSNEDLKLLGTERFRLSEQPTPIVQGVNTKSQAATFLPEITAVEHLPIIEFRKAFSNALRYPGYLRDTGPLLGDLQLRKQICKHILPHRGINVDLDQLVIASDVKQIILLAGLVLNGEINSVHYGNPGKTELSNLFKVFGFKTVAHSVDNEGITIDPFELLPKDVLIVSPEHHFPTGACLSQARRQKLIDHQLESGYFILENDSESEYYFDHLPNAAMFTYTNSQRHLYINSLSTACFNGLQIAYGVSNREFINEIAKAQKMISKGVSVLPQRWAAEMISSGAVSTHLSRMRNVYRRKRDALKQALTEVFPLWQVILPKGGLQICVEIPQTYSIFDIIAAARRTGAEVMDQVEYFEECTAPSRLIALSFSGDEPKRMKDSLFKLRQELDILKVTMI
ncbi:ARO8 Transcriptional regulators containing a DNA-binding HTH domain and an aminotransferase domain (MocR family) and their eukaryotic orthologs [Comamonadaceae bacterium]